LTRARSTTVDREREGREGSRWKREEKRDIPPKGRAVCRTMSLSTVAPEMARLKSRMEDVL
jgi:hypothetical protein